MRFCKGEYCKKWEIREEKVKGEKVYRLNVKKTCGILRFVLYADFERSFKRDEEEK